MRYIFLFLSLVFSQIIPFDQTLPILFSPVVQIKAGDEILYQLTSFRNTTCEATVTFHNSTFLPFSMLALPRQCAGYQVARFRIPKSVPNGMIAVEWACSGTKATAVDLMVVSHGMGGLSTFLRDIENASMVVECRENASASNC